MVKLYDARTKVHQHPTLVVAIPVCNEAQHLGRCLEALSSQNSVRLDHILLFLNNCTDASASIANHFPIHKTTRLHVIEQDLAASFANAGYARRIAMDFAYDLVGDSGILMTTDADSEVDPNWVAATLKVMAGGVNVVAGWVELDPIDWGQLPLRLHEDDARECLYDGLCDEINAWLDPDPWDPWPRHTQNSGSSIALTAEVYRRCGGVPAVASGEDRALISALYAVDARIRHAPEVRVSVSGRTVGRAVGGMAETIHRRLATPDLYLDERLEPAATCTSRALARAELRRLFDGTEVDVGPLAHRLKIAPQIILDQLSCKHFGTAWKAVEALTPQLCRRPVAVCDLPGEMASARKILRASYMRTGIEEIL
ncbi:MAG: glycosyltransferase [Oxalobacteraceae bacterium]|nr:MAG: glycosyltransferase [Oxalobacteraceae bacterium]